MNAPRLFVPCPDRHEKDGGCRRAHELVVVVGHFGGERFGSSKALGRLVAFWTQGDPDRGALRRVEGSSSL